VTMVDVARAMTMAHAPRIEEEGNGERRRVADCERHVVERRRVAGCERHTIHHVPRPREAGGAGQEAQGVDGEGGEEGGVGVKGVALGGESVEED